MATESYKITYCDGTTQELPRVWRQRPDQDWLVFLDEDSEILRVPAKSVRRVARTDVPPEEAPETAAA